jgi:hypothetical protein
VVVVAAAAVAAAAAAAAWCAAQNEGRIMSLFDAAVCGSISAVERLLGAGADIEQRKVMQHSTLRATLFQMPTIVNAAE